MTDSSVRQLFRTLGRRAGLARPIRPHMLRHAMGTELGRRRCADRCCSAAARSPFDHRAPRSYVHPSPLRLRDAVNRLEATAQRRVGPRARGAAMSRRDTVPGGSRLRPRRAGSSVGSLIDWDELRLRGWHPDGEVFVPNADDPVFGYPVCASVDCDQRVHHPGLGLCRRCQTSWEHSPPGMTLEEFRQTAPLRTSPVGGGLCLVCRTPGHERPVRGNGLCTACMAAARDHGQSVAEYVAGDAHFPPARATADLRRSARSWPVCVSRHRAHPALCEAHERTWVTRRAPERPSVRGLVRSGSGARCRQPCRGARRPVGERAARGALRASLRGTR